MSAHSIGGPACRIVRSPISGSRSRATPTPESTGCAASSRSTASSLARAIAAASRASRPKRLLGARLGRPPLDALDRHALALELVGEEVDACVRDRQRAPERWSATRGLPREPRRVRVAAASPRRPPPRADRAGRRAPAGRRPRRTAATMTCCVEPLDRRGQLAGRIGMGAVAEHDVEQQRRHSGSRPAATRRSSRSDGSIIGCARPRVNSSSPKSANSPPPTIRSASAHSVPPL